MQTGMQMALGTKLHLNPLHWQKHSDTQNGEAALISTIYIESLLWLTMQSHYHQSYSTSTWQCKICIIDGSDDLVTK